LQTINHTSKITELESILNQKGITKNKKWIREKDNNITQMEVTLMTYIRNLIHHPENRHNAQYTNNELQESISTMLQLAKGKNSNGDN
jgi:hypothetical protein